jgi:predicted metal-binding protein
MNNIKLVAISHETADLHKRALFHLSETEQAAFTEGVKPSRANAFGNL